MALPVITYLHRHTLQRKPPKRAHIDADSLRRNRASRAFASMRPFLETCTDARGLTSVSIALAKLASPLYPRWTSMITDEPVLATFVRHAAFDEEPTGEHAELARAARAVFPAGPPFRPKQSVGSAIASLDWEGETRVGKHRSWRDPVPPAPSFATFQELLERWEDANVPYSIFVDCTFLFVDEHGQRVPYSDEHFEELNWSFLQLHLQNGWDASVTYNLKFPWSAPDPALSALVARIADTLPGFDAKNFFLSTPGKDKAQPLTWAP